MKTTTKKSERLMAHATSEKEASINLPSDDQRRLAKVLLDPAPANDALKGAFQSYDEADVTSRA